MNIPDKVFHRLLKNVSIENSGCVVSNYATGSHGYCQIGWWENKKSNVVLAHRAAWIFKNGEIPNDMTIDHICKNKKCINTKHLRLLSNFENARRNKGDDFELGTCRNGHDYSYMRVITRSTKNGGKRFGRACSACIKNSYIKSKEKKINE